MDSILIRGKHSFDENLLSNNIIKFNLKTLLMRLDQNNDKNKKEKDSIFKLLKHQNEDII